MILAETYIQARLDGLSVPHRSEKPSDSVALKKAIVAALLSRKFRKYGVTPQLREHIERAVSTNVDAGRPINLTFVNGGYKLWRLDESPQVDWAEFFTVLHYTDWVKDVCAMYEPGVWFDFFQDDLIVPRINGMSAEDVTAYVESFRRMLEFVKPYQPKNLEMMVTRVGDQFESPEAFYASVDENIKTMAAKLPGGLPELSERDVAMLDLNVRPELREKTGEHWREKLFLIHEGYMPTKRSPGYHVAPEKILVFVTPLPNGMVLAVGSVRSSIAKFWIGVGALGQTEAGELFPAVLTPSQLKAASFTWTDIKIVGLSGKNFMRLRLLEPGLHVGK